MVTMLMLLAGVGGCGGESSDEPKPEVNRQTPPPPRIETIDDLEVDLSLLPPELQPLAPLIRNYAAGDDVERTDRLYAASPEELRELGRAMTVDRSDAIEAFLDAHLERTGTPEQDVAHVLSSFWEATAEAPVILEEREGS